MYRETIEYDDGTVITNIYEGDKILLLGYFLSLINGIIDYRKDLTCINEWIFRKLK